MKGIKSEPDPSRPGCAQMVVEVDMDLLLADNTAAGAVARDIGMTLAGLRRAWKVAKAGKKEA